MHFRKLSQRAPEVAADDESVRPILELLESEENGNPQDQMEAQQTSRLIVEVLDFLPYSYGRALEWKYVLGLSVSEIAERLSITELAAQSLLARARTAFKNALTQLPLRMASAIQE